MAICYAVLVDGGFIKHKIGTRDVPMDAVAFGCFVEALQKHKALIGHSLHRVYFYDAQPLSETVNKPLGGARLNFGLEPIAMRSKTLHQQVPKLPRVALRMGELVFRGWSVTQRRLKGAEAITITHEDLSPIIQQKAVDMRIGLDIAALTLKKIAKIIVLITADSDFIPAMKFARREGAQLYLVPLGHSIKDAMRDHSDLILDVSLEPKMK